MFPYFRRECRVFFHYSINEKIFTQYYRPPSIVIEDLDFFVALNAETLTSRITGAYRRVKLFNESRPFHFRATSLWLYPAGGYPAAKSPFSRGHEQPGSAHGKQYFGADRRQLGILFLL